MLNNARSTIDCYILILLRVSVKSYLCASVSNRITGTRFSSKYWMFFKSFLRRWLKGGENWLRLQTATLMSCFAFKFGMSLSARQVMKSFALESDITRPSERWPSPDYISQIHWPSAVSSYQSHYMKPSTLGHWLAPMWALRSHLVSPDVWIWRCVLP